VVLNSGGNNKNNNKNNNKKRNNMQNSGHLSSSACARTSLGPK
jgi:hypothetical protein